VLGVGVLTVLEWYKEPSGVCITKCKWCGRSLYRE